MGPNDMQLTIRIPEVDVTICKTVDTARVRVALKAPLNIGCCGQGIKR